MKNFLQSLQNNPLTGLIYSEPITMPMLLSSCFVFLFGLGSLLSSSIIVTSSSSTSFALLDTFFSNLVSNASISLLELGE